MTEENSKSVVPKSKATDNSLKGDIKSLLIKIAIIIVCAVLLFLFVFGITRTSDINMKPALSDGSLAIYYRLEREYIPLDVVIYKAKGKLTAGRVVAVAGDTVDITQERLLVNGALQQEEDITGKTERYEKGPKLPLKLQKDQVFVLGDNRENATDSRILGPLDIKSIKGKVIIVIKNRHI